MKIQTLNEIKNEECNIDSKYFDPMIWIICRPFSQDWVETGGNYQNGRQQIPQEPPPQKPKPEQVRNAPVYIPQYDPVRNNKLWLATT